jgi:hypothetical protein
MNQEYSLLIKHIRPVWRNLLFQSLYSTAKLVSTNPFPITLRFIQRRSLNKERTYFSRIYNLNMRVKEEQSQVGRCFKNQIILAVAL